MNRIRKIVFLTDCLAYLTGGAERQIFELGRGLDKNKYEVVVASLECEGPAPREVVESAGVRLEIFPVKRIYGLSGFREGLRFFRFLRRERIDILMTYHFSSDIWGTVCGRLAGVHRIVSNRRDMGFWRKPYHRWAYRLIHFLVDKVVVNAQAIKDVFMREERLPETKVGVIYNGIDLDVTASQRHKVSEIKEEIGVKKEDLIVMHVGCLTPVKDHTTLIRAFARIVRTQAKADEPGVKLVLVGDGPLRQELESLAAALGLREAGAQADNKVLFLGEREDARALLPAADICVLPSLSEGLSNSILEYMAAGKPVIATRVGGNPELIDDGVNGILVAKQDAEGLFTALKDLIDDKKKRKRMGAESLHRIREFEMEKMVRRYEGLFDTIHATRDTPHAAQYTPHATRHTSHDMRGTQHATPFKILHLISSGGMFGAEQILLILCRELNQGDIHSVAGVLHNLHNPHLEVAFKAKDEGLPYKIFDCAGRFDLRTVWRVLQYVKKANVDIIHTHNYKSNLIGLLAARLARIKVMATAHGFTDMNRKVGLYEMFDKFILHLFFNKVVCVSASVLPRLPARKKRVIANGIELDRFRPDEHLRAAMRRQLPAGEHEIVIGSVGRFSKEKNQMLLLKAVFPLMRQYKIMVMLVGDGETLEALTRYVGDRHIEDRVIFTGIVQEPARLYQALDIFVLPSLTEGVPLTLLEAMASGVAVVATRVGGIPDIIRDGQNGLMIQSGDRDGLQAILEKLIRDAGYRRKMARSGWEFVREHYAVDKMAHAYRDLYQN